jgi:cobalt-zinc-cadmium efflux system protein
MLHKEAAGLSHQHQEHSHPPHTHQDPEISGFQLGLVIIFNFVITIVEVVGGLIAGSLSLVSDALHNFSDGLALVISFLAMRLAGRNIDEQRTFGYRRASILAAMLNAAVLIGISLFLFREAYFKFTGVHPINGLIVIWVALVGLAANAAGVLLLRRSARSNLNLRSAYLHLLSDSFSSVGVILGGIAIYFWKIYWIDPVLTVLINLYILKGSYTILKETVNVLMQGTPAHIDCNRVVALIKQAPGVKGVHHFHLWCLDEQNLFLEAHLTVADIIVSNTEPLCRRIAADLQCEFGINHTTFQCETRDSDENEVFGCGRC